MKNSFKTIKQTLAVIGLLFVSTISVFAQAPYNAYLCGDGTVTFEPTFDTFPQEGDIVHWVKIDEETSTTDNVAELTVTAATTLDDLKYTTDAALVVGGYSYNMYVESADGCNSDPSADLTIYKLPEIDLTLASNIAQYCAEASGVEREATLTATINNTSLPDGVGFDYTWLATKDGTAVTTPSSIGTENGNIFTLTTPNAGVYNFTATASYTVPTILKSGSGGAGCPVSDDHTITVTPKPGTPVITIEAE